MPRRHSKKNAPRDWAPFRADERPVESFSPHGDFTLALAYANTYHVGMSSLGFQRVRTTRTRLQRRITTSLRAEEIRSKEAAGISHP